MNHDVTLQPGVLLDKYSWVIGEEGVENQKKQTELAMEWCEHVGQVLYRMNSNKYIKLWKYWGETQGINTKYFNYYWDQVFTSSIN